MDVVSIIQVIYLIECRPFVEPLVLGLEIFNEITTIVLVDLLTAFSEGNLHPSEL